MRPSFQTPVAESAPSTCATRHGHAARSHHRVQRLDAVNAVPEQIRMVLLQRARTVGDAAERPCRTPCSPRAAMHAGCEAQATNWRTRRTCTSSASRKIAIASASEPATGLSMNTGLPRLEHRPRLLQVRPAVDAFQQHDVDLGQQARRWSRRSRPCVCREVGRVARDAVLLDGMSWLPPGNAATTRKPARSPSPSGRCKCW